MKKYISFYLGFLGLLFLEFCTSVKPVATIPDDQLLRIANKRWPAATKESLIAGQLIYTTKCTQCHGIKSIQNRTEAEWIHEIDDMSPKAKLTPEEKEILSRYLLSARELK